MLIISRACFIRSTSAFTGRLLNSFNAAGNRVFVRLPLGFGLLISAVGKHLNELPSGVGLGTLRSCRVLKYLTGSVTRLLLLAWVSVHVWLALLLPAELLWPKPSVPCFCFLLLDMSSFDGSIDVTRYNTMLTPVLMDAEIKSNCYRLNWGILFFSNLPY